MYQPASWDKCFHMAVNCPFIDKTQCEANSRCFFNLREKGKSEVTVGIFLTSFSFPIHHEVLCVIFVILTEMFLQILDLKCFRQCIYMPHWSIYKTHDEQNSLTRRSVKCGKRKTYSQLLIWINFRIYFSVELKGSIFIWRLCYLYRYYFEYVWHTNAPPKFHNPTDK